MRRSIALVVLALLGVPAEASPATLGEQRVLLILTTWGPEPYAPAAIRAELDEAAAYMRSASFGKTWIAGDVTPWLHALPSKPGAVANLLVGTDDRHAVRVGRGRHRLQVVALDRAGNRSRPASRIVRP